MANETETVDEALEPGTELTTGYGSSPGVATGPVKIIEDIEEAGDAVEDEPGFRERRLAERRQADVVRGALQKLDAQHVLQAADAAADRRLSKAAHVRTLGEAARLRDGREMLELPQGWQGAGHRLGA
mgnify:CR=1 FL=1